MNKKECRKLALQLMSEQLLNTCYSLEREEYEDLTDEEIDMISCEVYKIREQFKTRYGIEE